jgi:RNA polymerase sigma-70 factor (ECF subfamily)
MECDAFARVDVIRVMPDAAMGPCLDVTGVMPSDGSPDDEQRFTALYRQHHARVHDFARRRVGRDLAQEVVAETFLVAWRRIDDVPDVAMPWLFRVALYEIANLRRRRNTAARLHDALRARHGEPVAGEEAGDVTDLARTVALAFAALPERDQEILRLAAWEQLSSVEGATVLGCSVSAYRMRLHRARERLADRSGAREQLRAAAHQPQQAESRLTLILTSERRPRPGPELAL